MSHGLDTDTHIYCYEHEFYPLSNFSSFQLVWCDLLFATSEHAYHWEKFHGHPEVQHAILHARSAHDAFRVSRDNASLVRSDWVEVRVGIMRHILRAKVSQHPYVLKKLLQTGARQIVENSWRDSFWGWGEGHDGENMLGRLWMEIRSEVCTNRQEP